MLLVSFRWTDDGFIGILEMSLDGREGVRTMEDVERFRLLGKYKTPRLRYGRKAFCEVRGEVTICGLSDAPIPWPIGKRGQGGKSLIVFQDLAKAMRRESNQPVAHWWGVDPQTLSKWRKELSVQRATEGTSRLHRENIEQTGEAMRALSVLKAGDPESCHKIAESRGGKPRPLHVLEAMHAARRGSHHTEEARRKMSATHRQRGTLVPGTIPWTAEEDELVRMLSTQEAVRRTGRTLSAVKARRRRLGVPDGRRRN
jgi:hypothetical protein